MTLVEFDYDETIKGFMILRDSLAKELKAILLKYENLWSGKPYQYANALFSINININDFRFTNLTDEEFKVLYKTFHRNLLYGGSELSMIDDILGDIADSYETSEEDMNWIQEEWIDIYEATYLSKDSCSDKDSEYTTKDTEFFY